MFAGSSSGRAAQPRRVLGGGYESGPFVSLEREGAKRGFSDLRGGATVRGGRLRRPERMREMMLTGRVRGAEDGEVLGLTHCAVDENEAMQLARNAARKILGNAQFANYPMIKAIPWISDMSRDGVRFTESLAAAMSQSTAEVKEGLRAFLEKRPPKFR